MSIEENKAQVSRFIEEIFNQGRFERLTEFYAAPELAGHMVADAPALRQAFPDLHFVIEDLIAEGDKVAVRYTITGTNNGPFMGRPPTGKSARWDGMTQINLRNGKFQEEWVCVDRMVVMKQLGHIPASAPLHPGYTGPANSR